MRHCIKVLLHKGNRISGYGEREVGWLGGVGWGNGIGMYCRRE